MSPLKHYQGPMLPGAATDPPFVPVVPNDPLFEAPEPAQEVDKPEVPQHRIDARVLVLPNSYAVYLEAGALHAEGHGEHPELAMMLAFTKLWSQIDRPRCAHCGQLLPEEGQTT